MQHWITTKTLLDINKNETETFEYKIYTIDSNGQTIDETEFDEAGNTVCKRIYRYFEDGEVKEYIEYDPNDELLERHIYLKNDFGEIDRIEHEFNEGHKSIKEFYYTDLGYADRVEIRNEHGEITGFEIYQLDEKGQVIEATELDADNNEVARLKKEYLENGLISVEKHFSQGKLFKAEYFEYDDYANLIKKTLKNQADNFVIIDQYQYDERHNMIYNCSHQNGLLVFENKCTYNEDNHLIAEEFFELDFWEKKISRHERLKHQLRG